MRNNVPNTLVSAAFKSIELGGPGCWESKGSKTSAGYGQALINGKRYYTHRLAYEVFYGPIPEGMEIDHLCRNRACARPSHLEAVPGRVNQLRSESPPAQNARKTHCPKGHPYSGINVRIVKKTGWRQCNECLRVTNRRLYAEMTMDQRRDRKARQKRTGRP